MMSDSEARIAETVARLDAEIRRRKIRLSPDGRMTEGAAEQLVGLRPGAFRKYRAIGTSPLFFRIAWQSARITYRADDLARWIEARRESP